MTVTTTQYKLSPPHFNVDIEGARVILKPIGNEQINNQYLSWLNDPQINRFLEVRYKKQTVGDIYSYINGLRNSNQGELFAVFDKKRNVHVGNAAITSFNPKHQGIAVYGAMIGEHKAQVLGLGADSEALIIDFLFSHPVIRKVKAGVYEENQKSWHLLESLGLKREGSLREEAILPPSKVCDVFVYGILRNEWELQKLKLGFLLANVQIRNRQ